MTSWVGSLILLKMALTDFWSMPPSSWQSNVKGVTFCKKIHRQFKEADQKVRGDNGRTAHKNNIFPAILKKKG